MAADPINTPCGREQKNFAQCSSVERMNDCEQRAAKVARTTPRFPAESGSLAAAATSLRSFSVNDLDDARSILGEVSALTELLSAGFDECAKSSSQHGGEMLLRRPSTYARAFDGIQRLIQAADHSVTSGMGDQAISDAARSCQSAPPRQVWTRALADVQVKEAGGLDDEAETAENYLINNVPAPDSDALAVKVVRALARGEPFEEVLLADHAAAIAADASRIVALAMGGGA